MRVILNSPTVRVMQSALFQTNTTLFNLKGLNLLTDPGWIPEEIVFLQTLINNQPLFLAFTHADYDHLAGSGAYPNCRNIMSATMAEHTLRENAIQKITDLDLLYYFKRTYILKYPNPDLEIKKAEQHFSIEENDFIALLIPGHTAGDMALYCVAQKVLILGDYVSKLEFPFIEHSFADYLTSLVRLQQFISLHKPKLIVPGHGPLYQDYRDTLHRISIDLSYLENLKVNSRPWEEWAASYTFAQGLLATHQNNLKYI